MEKNQEQQEKKPETKDKELPMEESPYVKYKDLEDYKLKGYGAQGHQEPKPGRGAGSTDAPTPSGAAVKSDADLSATEAINRQGVP